MQCFVEWENYQLKRSQNWNKTKSTSLLQKPGIISILVIIVAASHLYVTFFISNDLKTPTYHLFKVFWGLYIVLRSVLRIVALISTCGHAGAISYVLMRAMHGAVQNGPYMGHAVIHASPSDFKYRAFIFLNFYWWRIEPTN